jgi:hypothetical protein
MADPNIRIKRSSVPGKRPTVNDLPLGELGLNTYDAELFARRERVGIGTEVVRLGVGATVTNILYVTQDGIDTNTGKKLGDAKRTIGAALTAATTGTVIKVSAGSYLENNPLIIPQQVSIVGDSLREVSVQPLNPNEDLFYVSNGNYIAEMSYTGTLNPGKAIFSFNPIQISYFDQSPYVQNCTNFIPNSIGMKIDGSNAIGPTKSMVVDSYTQYNQGGIGVSITNEGYAQLVSLFTICDEIAVFCGSGAACDLTNSNSSFGDFALVADGVGPKKYTGIVTSAAAPNADTFVLDLNTPTLNITNASYDNTNGVLKAYTSIPHKFSVGMGVSIAGLGFTCPFEPGIRYYPSGQSGYVFEIKTVAPGRYVDAGNLIVANKTEIVDKSLAAIALNHPDFYFPGDSANDASYRFKDSYRLIQQNKQEIVDKSLASIAIGFPSAFNFPTDPVPYSQNRYYDASRLIQINKQEIIDKSLASIAVGFPSSFNFPTDPVPYSQNRYYDASRLIQINKQEIIDKSLASVAIAHSDFYFPGDTQTNARSRYYDAYRLIQRNRDVIVGTAWTNTYNAYPGISTTEVKCKRDIGFFIDAVSADVFTGGNNYAKQFTLQYFDGAGNPISNGLVGEETQSIYAFQQARDLMKSAITNTLVGAAYSDLTLTVDPLTGSNVSSSSCADVQTNIDTLVGIVTTVIGAGTTSSLPSTNLGSFTTGGIKCARDLGFLVDAISTDVFTGGNKYARDFTLQYFNGNVPISNGLVGETNESITAFNALRDYAKKAVSNQLNAKNLLVSAGFSTYNGGGSIIPVDQSGNANACADVQSSINTLVGIVTAVIGAGSTSFLNTFNENLGISTTNKCARDLGYLVDALSTDIFTGGNKYARDFTLQYFDGATPIGIATTERQQSVYAFNSLRDYAKKAVSNQLNAKNLLVSAGLSTYAGIGSTVPVDQSGNANACADVQSSINTLVGIVTTIIGAGNTSSLPTINLGISTTNKCARDIGYFVDAVSTDIFTGGNSYVIGFTRQYFTAAGAATTALLGEESESVYAFNSVRDYAKKAITNQLNIRDLTITADPNPGIGTTSNVNPYSCTNVRDAIDTLVGISTQAIGVGNLNTLNSISLNGGTFLTGESKCRRDLGYIVDAVASDVRNFTNESIIQATKSYFTSSGTPISNGLVGETAESITAFNAVGSYSKLAINNMLNAKDLTVAIDPLTGSNTDPLSCADVRSNIDNIVGIITTFVGQGSLIGLPSVSMASTVFTMNVGVATQPHTYVPNTGTAKINIVRPFDGQVVYFGDLYYTVGGITIGSGGTGYTGNVNVNIDSPETPWGISATAVAEVKNGSVISVEMISNGRGYTSSPKVTFSSPDVGINTAIGTANLVPTYYVIQSSTLPSSGICTVVLSDNVPYAVGVGTQAPFFKQSRVLASGHSLEYIGSGTNINGALPAQGGVPIQENETVSRNGGLVVFTSTDQSGNFRIGEGVAINQQTGSISGAFYSKSLFSTMTPFILALGGD